MKHSAETTRRIIQAVEDEFPDLIINDSLSDLVDAVLDAVTDDDIREAAK